MVSSCYDYCLKYLYHYPKTEQELRIKLYQKWYSTLDVQETFQKLKTKWFLDDKKFAESYINSEIINKWKPVIAVMKKLQQKWISTDMIKEQLSYNQSDIIEWLHKKIKKEIENYKRKWIDWFDIIQKLMKKWYRLDDIKKVIEASNK
jgi:regulatory protein